MQWKTAGGLDTCLCRGAEGVTQKELGSDSPEGCLGHGLPQPQQLSSREVGPPQKDPLGNDSEWQPQKGPHSQLYPRRLSRCPIVWWTLKLKLSWVTE